MGLEHVAEQISRALTPGGLFVMHDYVGPNGFELPQRQWELCQAALQLLPKRLRTRVSWARRGRVGPGASRTWRMKLRLTWLKLRHGTLVQSVARRVREARLRSLGLPCVKEEIIRLRAAEVHVDDPTEAVRAQDILPVLRERFEILEERALGGSLLMPVLDDLAGNFAETDDVASRCLRLLFELEDAALAAGEVGSDFVFAVARRRA